MYVYGGTGMNNKLRRQISTVVGCSLKRVGTLDFAFLEGACTVAGDTIYLCFPYVKEAFKLCQKSSKPRGFENSKTYKQVEQSNHEHTHTKMASSKGMITFI